MIQKLLKKYFESLSFFYTYLGYRIYIIIILSILIGVLDGLGLTMFLPLLRMVNDSSEVDPEELGNLQFVVDFIESLGSDLNLVSILSFMVIFFFGKAVASYFSGVYRVHVKENFIKNLRITNISGLNGLSYKYFIASDIGRIQNTLTGEVDRVANAFVSYFKAMEFGILVIVYMGFAFRVDPEFALLVTLGGVLTNFLYKALYKNTKGFSRALTGENNVFQSLIIQNVGNYKYLKATGSLGKYGNKLKESVFRIQDTNVKIGKLDALLYAGKEPILMLVVVTVIFIQTQVLGSPLAPILVSLLFFYRALTYLMQMQTRWNKFLAVSGSLENMTSFEEELANHQESTGETEGLKEIEMFNISKLNFFYGENQVLKEVSLKIHKHETVAFVGESGSGKTTLVNIISGLLPVEKGSYIINGNDIANINTDDLQRKIGYITQDPVIFNDTLFNNVSFWEEKTEENYKKFIRAIQQAAVFDFVESLVDKEETVLGNNGVNLSGGQRQRISIARELYKNVEVLILDEATSALDSETEKAIQSNIDDLRGDFTILIVAHRISTIKNADRIVVMKSGKISNIGSFSELVQNSMYFKKLVELQEI